MGPSNEQSESTQSTLQAHRQSASMVATSSPALGTTTRPTIDQTQPENLEDDSNIELIDRRPLLTPRVPEAANNVSAAHPQHEKFRNLPAGWPKQPGTLRRDCGSIGWSLCADVLLGLLATAFFVFGIVVAVYRQAPVAQNTRVAQALINVANLSPSVFPILYAAILGRLIKAIMLRLLERGEKRGLLDLLAGSTTVANAFFSQVSLRILSVTGVVVAIAWAVSPVGGQASLRVVTLGKASSFGEIEVEYMNSSYANPLNSYSASGEGNMMIMRSTLLSTSVLSPHDVKQSPRDIWGNPKVPVLELAIADSSVPDPGGWYTVPDHDVSYASLVGIPMSGLSSEKVSHFDMQANYWKLDCPLLESNSDHKQLFNFTSWYQTSDANTIFFTNRSFYAIDKAFIDPDLPPRYLGFRSWAPDFVKYDAICTMRTEYVDVHMECEGHVCTTTKIRNATYPHPFPCWTPFDNENEDLYWSFFYNKLATIVNDNVHPAYAGWLDGYLLDPLSPLAPGDSSSLTNPEVFALRLSQILNTFCLISAGPTAIPYGLTESNYTFIGSQIEEPPPDHITILANSIRDFEVIRCHVPWLVILLSSSMAMLVAAITCVVLRINKITPDLALNFSTVIRDNQYCCDIVPETGSRLDDLERSRLLRNNRIMFGNVASEGSDVGHLAISDQNGVRPARREQVYD